MPNQEVGVQYVIDAFLENRITLDEAIKWAQLESTRTPDCEDPPATLYTFFGSALFDQEELVARSLLPLVTSQVQNLILTYSPRCMTPSPHKSFIISFPLTYNEPECPSILQEVSQCTGGLHRCIRFHVGIWHDLSLVPTLC